MNIMLLSDGYKLSHHRMYPQGTELVFSNLTPRSSKHAPKGAPTNGVIVMGIRKAMYDLNQVFKDFFSSPFDESIKEMYDNYLSTDYSIDHFRELHELGYLPVHIRAMDEGSFCPIGVPFFTIHNTDKRFFWLTNFLETYLSANLWKSTTSATIASSFYYIASKNFLETTGTTEGMNFNIHNFSARGMDSVDAMIQADLGHLLFFNGSDTLATMGALKSLYGVTKYMGNVPASEHSVMSAGTKENELDTYSYLLDQFPEGFLSLVSDTWDLWNVINNILPKLKEKIMGRNGRLVIRPDSGNPVDILCGNIGNILETEGLTTDDLCDSDFEEFDYFRCKGKLYKIDHEAVEEMYEDYGREQTTLWEIGYSQFYSEVEVSDSPEAKGVVELLWDIFGGTTNAEGYKVLDTHIGVIYGDSITVERQKEIYDRLKAKGFASSNVVLGVGSYTYQYNTRDSFGMAVKATYTERNGQGFDITKDPITDDGTKKSATGLLSVIDETLIQRCTWNQVYSDENMLKQVFDNGNITFTDSWETITERAKNNVSKLKF